MQKKYTVKALQAIFLVVSSVLIPGWAEARTASDVSVVTSFSVLADLVEQVGGDAVSVTSLVGPDEDAHVYSPTPDDARAILTTRIVIKNGLGFEPWLDRLLESTGTTAMQLNLGDTVLPLRVQDSQDTEIDPHAWHDIANIKTYVQHIAGALGRMLPDQRADIERRAQAYTAALTEAEQSLRNCLATVPESQRKIVTSHDAFGYFGRAYGVRFLAPQGISTDTQPSARDVALLIDQIRREKITAVFVENIRDDRLIRQIADETGARIGGTLYSDALSKAAPANTYLGMFQHNAERICSALAPK